jgi:hypothetical protein
VRLRPKRTTRRAPRHPRRPRSLAKVELGPAARTIHPLEHLALREFSRPCRPEDALLCHGMPPAKYFGRFATPPHRSHLTLPCVRRT